MGSRQFPMHRGAPTARGIELRDESGRSKYSRSPSRRPRGRRLRAAQAGRAPVTRAPAEAPVSHLGWTIHRRADLWYPADLFQRLRQRLRETLLASVAERAEKAPNRRLRFGAGRTRQVDLVVSRNDSMAWGTRNASRNREPQGGAAGLAIIPISRDRIRGSTVDSAARFVVCLLRSKQYVIIEAIRGHRSSLGSISPRATGWR